MKIEELMSKAKSQKLFLDVDVKSALDQAVAIAYCTDFNAEKKTVGIESVIGRLDYAMQVAMAKAVAEFLGEQLEVAPSEMENQQQTKKKKDSRGIRAVSDVNRNKAVKLNEAKTEDGAEKSDDHIQQPEIQQSIQRDRYEVAHAKETEGRSEKTTEDSSNKADENAADESLSNSVNAESNAENRSEEPEIQSNESADKPAKESEESSNTPKTAGVNNAETEDVSSHIAATGKGTSERSMSARRNAMPVNISGSREPHAEQKSATGRRVATPVAQGTTHESQTKTSVDTSHVSEHAETEESGMLISNAAEDADFGVTVPKNSEKKEPGTKSAAEKIADAQSDFTVMLGRHIRRPEMASVICEKILAGDPEEVQFLKSVQASKKQATGDVAARIHAFLDYADKYGVTVE